MSKSNKPVIQLVPKNSNAKDKIIVSLVPKKPSESKTKNSTPETTLSDEQKTIMEQRERISALEKTVAEQKLVIAKGAREKSKLLQKNKIAEDGYDVLNHQVVLLKKDPQTSLHKRSGSFVAKNMLQKGSNSKN